MVATSRLLAAFVMAYSAVAIIPVPARSDYTLLILHHVSLIAPIRGRMNTKSVKVDSRMPPQIAPGAVPSGLVIAIKGKREP